MSDMVFCRGCGQEIHKTAHACPGCGAVIGTKKSRTTAAILAFLFGGFGAHKFYLGKSGQGILFFLFFWTFIPAIIAFIEMIMFICMSDEDFSKKYSCN